MRECGFLLNPILLYSPISSTILSLYGEIFCILRSVNPRLLSRFWKSLPAIYTCVADCTIKYKHGISHFDSCTKITVCHNFPWTFQEKNECKHNNSNKLVVISKKLPKAFYEFNCIIEAFKLIWNHQKNKDCLIDRNA